MDEDKKGSQCNIGHITLDTPLILVPEKDKTLIPIGVEHASQKDKQILKV